MCNSAVGPDISSSQVSFIYTVLYIIQTVLKQLHSDKQKR